jgi:hypothetical protein
LDYDEKKKITTPLAKGAGKRFFTTNNPYFLEGLAVMMVGTVRPVE